MKCKHTFTAPMVLSHKIGKERNFAVVLLLFIVTFGIYGIYWNYKAHSEVYKQFELIHEGRDEGIVWFILGLVVFPPLVWIYHAIFLGNTRYVRERLGMRRNMGPGGFLGMSIPGDVLSRVGLVMLIVGVAWGLSEPNSDESRGPLLTPDEAQDLQERGDVLVAIAIPLLLLGMALQIAAYARLQGQLNAVWRGYDQRMTELRPGGSSPEDGLPSDARSI